MSQKIRGKQRRHLLTSLILKKARFSLRKELHPFISRLITLLWEVSCENVILWSRSWQYVDDLQNCFFFNGIFFTPIRLGSCLKLRSLRIFRNNSRWMQSLKMKWQFANLILIKALTPALYKGGDTGEQTKASRSRKTPIFQYMALCVCCILADVTWRVKDEVTMGLECNYVEYLQSTVNQHKPVTR